METRKKVVFFFFFSVGGAERVTITISKLLDQSKYDVQFAIVGNAFGDIRQFIPANNNIFLIKIRNIWDFTTFKIYRFLKKHRPNIVFSSLCYLNSRVVLAAHFIGGIKTIIRNNNNYFTERNIVTKLLRRWCYPMADEVIMQTEEMAIEFQNLFPGKCKNINVIHNPLDIDTITRCTKDIMSPFEKEYVNYVYVGRITKVKGLDVLVSAFAKVTQNLSKNCRLYIVGKVNKDDLFYTSLIALLRKIGIEESVIFTGFSSNPYQYIKHANCLVLPSRNEGLPNVILEAMYLQCPVVVSRSIPIIDRLVPKDRGIVVDVDDVEGLSKAMIDILSYKIIKKYEQPSKEQFIRLFE